LIPVPAAKARTIGLQHLGCEYARRCEEPTPAGVEILQVHQLGRGVGGRGRAPGCSGLLAGRADCGHEVFCKAGLAGAAAAVNENHPPEFAVCVTAGCRGWLHLCSLVAALAGNPGGELPDSLRRGYRWRRHRSTVSRSPAAALRMTVAQRAS